MDVKTLCLGLLSRGDYSGYEIRKQFEEGAFSHFQDAGFGSIYPALKRLTEEGLATCSAQAQESRPDKKVYRITPRGREALLEAVNEPPAPDKLRSDFMFVLYFADLVPPRQLDRLIAGRIAHHEEVIARLEAIDLSRRTSEEAFVIRYGIALHRAARDYFETHRHELVGDSIRSGATA